MRLYGYVFMMTKDLEKQPLKTSCYSDFVLLNKPAKAGFVLLDDLASARSVVKYWIVAERFSLKSSAFTQG
jgi:hypothetical protein